MSIRILPESSANQNLRDVKEGDILVLAEISYTSGEYTDTYYVDKSGLLWIVGDWVQNKPHGFHLEDLANILQWKDMSRISAEVRYFLNTTHRTYDLERAYASQKSNNQETHRSFYVRNGQTVENVNGVEVPVSWDKSQSGYKDVAISLQEQLDKLRKELYRVEVEDEREIIALNKRMDETDKAFNELFAKLNSKINDVTIEYPKDVKNATVVRRIAGNVNELAVRLDKIEKRK